VSPPKSGSQYYKNLPPAREMIKDTRGYFFSDQKEGNPYDDIEEGKKRVRGMF